MFQFMWFWNIFFFGIIWKWKILQQRGNFSTSFTWAQIWHTRRSGCPKNNITRFFTSAECSNSCDFVIRKIFFVIGQFSIDVENLIRSPFGLKFSILVLSNSKRIIGRSTLYTWREIMKSDFKFENWKFLLKILPLGCHFYIFLRKRNAQITTHPSLVRAV